MEQPAPGTPATKNLTAKPPFSTPPFVDETGGSMLWPSRKSAQMQRLVVPVLLVSDALVALLTWEISSVLQNLWGRGPLAELSISTVLAGIAVWMGLRALLGLYPGYGLGQVEELRRQTYAVLAAVGIVAVFAVASQVGGLLSRLLLALTFLGLLLAAPPARYFVKLALMRLGLWGKPVVLFGCGEYGARVVRSLRRDWELGLDPIAVFDNRRAPTQGLLEGVPYMGTLSEAMQLARERRVNAAIFAMPRTQRQHLARFVDIARLHFRQVLVIPDLDGITNSAVVARDLGGTFGVEIRYNLLDQWALRTKRTMDFVATLVGGLVVSPLIVALCLIVWLETRGNVFYRAQRMGRDGTLFSCMKFQTMVPNAEAVLQQLLAENEDLRKEYTQYHKLRDDPRITRIGHFLRKTSLDELPQLWNVMRGEMSLVGPRPYLPRESSDIGETQGEILRVPPGITGPWQVSGRNHTSFAERVRMDVDYVHNWSVWLDLVLLASTVRSVVFDRGGC